MLTMIEMGEGRGRGAGERRDCCGGGSVRELSSNLKLVWRKEED